ncbi:hypothetical protein KW784_01530 [Candidatus Parcubacteria bacterium]|nr:hypothetical protein [Candidatus Parcubacteria bacterium]
MDILGCDAVVVARIRFRIDWMSPGSGPVELRENLPGGKRFSTWVPKKWAAQLSEGDEVEVLCAVSPDFSLGRETYVLAKKEGNLTRTLFSTSSIWVDVHNKLIR